MPPLWLVVQQPTTTRRSPTRLTRFFTSNTTPSLYAYPRDDSVKDIALADPPSTPPHLFFLLLLFFTRRLCSSATDALSEGFPTSIHFIRTGLAISSGLVVENSDNNNARTRGKILKRAQIRMIWTDRTDDDVYDKIQRARVQKRKPGSCKNETPRTPRLGAREVDAKESEKA